MSSVAFLVLLFGAIVFLLFGGPLWLARRLPLSKVSPEAPRWCGVAVPFTSRLAGAVLLGYWLWTVTGGDALQTFWLAVLVLAGLSLLVNAPLWLVVCSRTFSRGRQSPLWLETTVVWVNRIIGAGAISAGLLVSLWHWFPG